MLFVIPLKLFSSDIIAVTVAFVFPVRPSSVVVSCSKLSDVYAGIAVLVTVISVSALVLMTLSVTLLVVPSFGLLFKVVAEFRVRFVAAFGYVLVFESDVTLECLATSVAVLMEVVTSRTVAELVSSPVAWLPVPSLLVTATSGVITSAVPGELFADTLFVRRMVPLIDVGVWRVPLPLNGVEFADPLSVEVALS